MSVELHGAFVWDCDACGRENFERSVEGDLDEASMNDLAGEPAVQFLAPDYEEDEETGEGRAAMLITRILIVPRNVTCKHCEQTFETEVAALEDDDQ